MAPRWKVPKSFAIGIIILTHFSNNPQALDMHEKKRKKGWMKQKYDPMTDTGSHGIGQESEGEHGR